MREVQVSAPTETTRQPTTNSRTKGEIVPAEADRLVELASYQQGSVVSRVLIRRSTGNVTLFAFDEGQELSEHTAPFDAFVHVLEGTAEIVIDGKRFELGAGEVILMPANRPHALRAISKFKMLLIMIRS
jgi:quercetin dioxygenase-like cupin family protein